MLGASIDGIDPAPTMGTAAVGGMPSGSVLPPFPTDMDVDADDALGLDPHNTPIEKTDADFFNDFDDDFDDDDL